MCGVLLSSAEEKKEIPIKKDPEPTPEFRMPYYSYDMTVFTLSIQTQLSVPLIVPTTYLTKRIYWRQGI